MKITICAFKKNAYKLKNPSYYARVKVDGKTRDIPLHTSDKDVADAWVRLRRAEVQRYNDYIVAGEQPPPDLLDRLIIAKKGTPTASIQVRESVESFELHLRRSGHREATINTYLRALRNCIDFSQPLSAVTERFLTESLRKHDHLKAATRKSYCVTVREWVKFCVKEYGLNRDLIDCFTFIKVQTEEKGFWTMNEMRRIIDNVQCRDEATTQCYKAYFWLMATTGARQGEAAALEWSDLRDGAVTFRAETTKSGQTRTCPLTIGVLDLLNRLPKVSKRIFAYLGNQQASRYGVLSKAVEKAGVRQGGLHTFRHSASMYLYSKISDIKLVSQILGHSPATALRYYQATREVDKVSDAITEAYDGEQNLPSLMDWFVENDLL